MSRPCCWRLVLALSAIVGALPAAAPAEVYRCTVDGKAIYSDRPCGTDAKTVKIAPDPNAPARGNFKPGIKLPVSDAVIRECYDAYRTVARDPTTAKMLWTSTTVPETGIPIVVVGAIFTNRFGGPDNYQCWCRLTDDLQLDRRQTAERVDAFRETQDEFHAKIRGIERALKGRQP